jgi:hypothetical protein
MLMFFGVNVRFRGRVAPSCLDALRAVDTVVPHVSPGSRSNVGKRRKKKSIGASRPTLARALARAGGRYLAWIPGPVDHGALWGLPLSLSLSRSFSLPPRAGSGVGGEGARAKGEEEEKEVVHLRARGAGEVNEGGLGGRVRQWPVRVFFVRTSNHRAKVVGGGKGMRNAGWCGCR